MKKIKFLILSFLFIIPLFSEEENLGDYNGVLKSSIKLVPEKVKPAIERGNLIKDKYQWLVFVFIDGVNDLGIGGASVDDINEMEMVGSNDKMAVVVEHNRIKVENGKIKFSTSTPMYFIIKDEKGTEDIISPVIDETPDTNMGSYIHFARSVEKAVKRFNPDKLMVILWNHGNGYMGISYDDVSQNSINIIQLKNALSNIKKAYGRKIDIFAMDACLMQMAEVVGELKDYADYILASEEEVPGAGFPYDDLLGCVNRSRSIREVGICQVNAYYNAYENGKVTNFGYYGDRDITLSLISTSKFSGFVSLLNRWVKTALESDDFKLITSSNIVEKSFFFSHGDKDEAFGNGPINYDTMEVMTRSADIISYLKGAKKVMKDASLINITDELIEYITKELVIHHKGGSYQNADGLGYNSDTYGLSIYLPKLRYNVRHYNDLDFARMSLWDEFLKSMLLKNKDQINEEFLNGSGKDVGGGDKVVEQKEVSADAGKKNSTRAYSSFNITGNDTGKIYVKENGVKQPLELYAGGKNGSIKISQNIAGRPSINSMSYIKEKTLTPDPISLMENRTTPHNLPYKNEGFNKTLSDKRERSSGFEKAKDLTKSMLNSISEKARDVFETIFPDKEKRRVYEEKLKEFEIKITRELDINYARKLVEDQSLRKEFFRIDSKKAAKLLSYSNEIIEIDKIVSGNYSEKDLNSLSKTLENILDSSRLICELNICLPPENLSQWMIKTNRYTPVNISNTEFAIRKWEKIFDTDAFQVRWGNLRAAIIITTATWMNMSVRERNATLEQLAVKGLMKGDATFAKFSDKRNEQLKSYKELSMSVAKISQKMLDLKILTPEQLSAIRNKPLSEQMYILSNLFDRGGLKEDQEVTLDIKKINANRSSAPGELASDQQFKIVSKYMSDNLSKNLSKSKTATLLYSNLYSSKKPDISFEYLKGMESTNKNGRIILDRSIVDQFLRVKGYSSTDLVKNDGIKAELLDYLSPLIVREMGNMMVSGKIKGYNPQTREKYAVALLYQAKYSEEAMRNEDFKKTFKEFEGVSDYADRVMVTLRNYKDADNKEDFIQSAGIKYYPNLPSSSLAKSEILLAITKELERRNNLPGKEKENVDKYAIFDSNNISTLSPFDITNYIKDIKTDALIKLRKEILSNGNFSDTINKLIVDI